MSLPDFLAGNVGCPVPTCTAVQPIEKLVLHMQNVHKNDQTPKGKVARLENFEKCAKVCDLVNDLMDKHKQSDRYSQYAQHAADLLESATLEAQLITSFRKFNLGASAWRSFGPGREPLPKPEAPPPPCMVFNADQKLHQALLLQMEIENSNQKMHLRRQELQEEQTNRNTNLHVALPIPDEEMLDISQQPLTDVCKLCLEYGEGEDEESFADDRSKLEHAEEHLRYSVIDNIQEQIKKCFPHVRNETTVEVPLAPVIRGRGTVRGRPRGTRRGTATGRGRGATSGQTRPRGRGRGSRGPRRRRNMLERLLD